MNKDKYITKILPVLREQGLALPMESIADAIGITKKTLYNQFSSKDELISVCVDSLMEEFHKKVECLSDPSVPVEDGFRRGIDGLRNFFRDCSHIFMADLPKYYPKMASEGHVTGTGFFEAQLKSNIDRGIASGDYRAEIDSALFSKYIATSVFGFFQREIMRSAQFSAEHYFNQVIEFNINALKARK